MKTLEVLSHNPEPASPVTLRFYNPEPEKRRVYIALCIALWSVLAYLFISHFVMMTVQIKGLSMSPTLQDGQRFLLFRCPYLWRSPQTGEIVVIRDPEDHNLSIKRIIAVPNQWLEIRRDGVYVDDKKLAEPYLTSQALSASGNKRIDRFQLGQKEYYVMGDNRDWSADSRIYGPVTRNAILGLINRPK